MSEPDMTWGGTLKANRYELVKGCIRPVSGARFSAVDAMAVYDRARSQHRGHQSEEAPYTSLIRMVSRLSWRMGVTGPELTPESQELLLAWVNTFGLLGLLDHQVVQLQGDVHPEGAEDSGLAPNWLVMWSRNLQFGADRFYLVPRMLPLKTCRAIRAFAQGLGDETIREQPWQELARPFFPEYALGTTEFDRFYPTFDHPAFLDNYAEPLDQFLGAANTLKAVSDAMASLPLGPETLAKDPESDFDANVFQAEALSPLNVLLSAVQPVVWPNLDSGMPQGRLRSPSLLGLLAAQLYLDITGDEGKLHKCKQCELSFFSTGYQATYCSAECRQAAIRRARRQK